jgi:hypothetical protein
LLELISVDRVIQEIREIGEKLEIAVHDIRGRLQPAGRGGAAPCSRHGVTIGAAAIARVERIEPPDLTPLDGAAGNLVGRAPLSPVGHQCHVRAVAVIADCVTQQGVDPPVIVGPGPRAIVMHELERVSEVASGHARRSGEQRSAVPASPHTEFGDAGIETPGDLNARRACCGEITFLREVGPFSVPQVAYELGDQEVQVCITLTVPVRAHVDGNAVDADGEIGSMIEVETAQEILIRLALSAMLRNDDAGHIFENFSSAVRRARLDLITADHALTRRVRTVPISDDFDRRERHAGRHRADRHEQR